MKNINVIFRYAHQNFYFKSESEATINQIKELERNIKQKIKRPAELMWLLVTYHLRDKTRSIAFNSVMNKSDLNSSPDYLIDISQLNGKVSITESFDTYSLNLKEMIRKFSKEAIVTTEFVNACYQQKMKATQATESFFDINPINSEVLTPLKGQLKGFSVDIMEITSPRIGITDELYKALKEGKPDYYLIGEHVVTLAVNRYCEDTAIVLQPLLPEFAQNIINNQ